MPNPEASTVCILYGLCEGRHIGKRLEQQLVNSGFRVTRDAKTANILVAHSGGCFSIPRESAAQLIVLIGLPFWPGKSMLRCLTQKIWLDIRTSRGRTLFFMEKSAWHLIYFWNVANNLRMLRGRASKLWGQNPPTVLIQNCEDPMCTSDIEALQAECSAILLNMKGQHDDCWENSAPYVGIIKAYHERLLAQTN